MVRLYRLCVCVLLLLAAPAFGQGGGAPRAESAMLATQLESGDAAACERALERVRELLAENPKKWAVDVNNRWVKALLRGKRWSAAAELAAEGIAARPDSAGIVYGLQEARTRALLADGKTEQALRAAKSAFNVAPMARTGEAVMLLAECLHAVDPARAEQFRKEQIAGAEAPRAANAPNPPATQSGAGSVLAGIKGETELYKPLADDHPDATYHHKVAVGNLLLLADKPRAARALFDQAYQQAPETLVDAATENIARAIKAEDGTIARANEWILAARRAAGPGQE